MSYDHEDLEGMESHERPDYAERMYEQADLDRKREKEYRAPLDRFECVIDESAGQSSVCPRCDGSGDIHHAGHSLNPSSGVLVRDPQCDIDEECPECRGTGAASNEGEYEPAYDRREDDPDFYLESVDRWS